MPRMGCGVRYQGRFGRRARRVRSRDRLEHLRALHINDSLNTCGAHKDRHARIGEGQIGAEALVRVLEHPALQGLPAILETPNELPGYAKEISFFREAVGQ